MGSQPPSPYEALKIASQLLLADAGKCMLHQIKHYPKSWVVFRPDVHETYSFRRIE